MNRKECAVLGCGPSVTQFKNKELLRIGVNYAWKFHRLDWLFVQDKAKNFEVDPEKKQIMENSRPIAFYCPIDEAPYFKAFGFDPIGYQPILWFDRFLDSGKVMKYGRWVQNVGVGMDSTFSAVVFAILCGFEYIEVWGADYTDHEYFKDKIPTILEFWKSLFEHAMDKGVTIHIGPSKSILHEIMPKQTNEPIFE